MCDNLNNRKVGRVAWLDNVKMFAMLFVIFGHIITIVVKTNIDFSGQVIEHLIVAFDMPLFVIVSGYSNFNAITRITDMASLSAYVKKSVIRILLPVAVFTFLNAHVNFIFSNFWFLNMILYLMLTFAIIYLAIEKTHINHGLIISIIVFISIMIWIDNEWIGEMSTYYVVGMLCKRYSAFTKPHKFLFPTMLVMGLLLFILYWLIGVYAQPENSFYSYTFSKLVCLGKVDLWLYRQVLAIILSIAVIGMFLNNNGPYNRFSRMGSYTLSFYLFHATLLRPFHNTYILNMFHSSSVYQFLYSTELLRWIIAIVVFLLFTVISWMLICLCDKNRWTRFLLLGKKLD